MKPVEEQFITIQSAYREESLSRKRLEITKNWLIPSLKQQTVPITVIVSLCELDPILEERKKVFRGCDQKVQFVYRDPTYVPVHLNNVCNMDPWNVPVGPRVAVSRCDDDDAISIDFMAHTLNCAQTCDFDEALLIWPNGYSFYGGILYRCRHIGNQFPTIVSSRGVDPHYRPHKTLYREFHRIAVNYSRGWIWNRHENTITGTLKRYRAKVADPPNRYRWAVSLP